MRKRVIVLVVAWLSLVGGVAQSYADLPPPDSVPQTAAGRSPGIAVGESFTLEPPSARYMQNLDLRERREQARDWAVLGTVARLGVAPEQLAAATYELPVARLPYLEELYTFEYGRGRRAYVDDRILLFRDRDDPDPQVTIGRLADRIRMESGDAFTKVEIYLVSDERYVGEIQVERADDVTRAALFSPAYGYVQGEGGDLAKLTAWLGSADDLTFAQLTADGRLVLGGRRFARTSTSSLTIDDVAAIYQAHEELDPYMAARHRIAALPAPVQAAVSRVASRLQGGTLDVAASQADLRVIASAVPDDEFREVVAAWMDAAYSPHAPGFSLDPQWLPSVTNPARAALVDGLRRLATDPCGDLRALTQQAEAILRQEPDPTRRTSRGAHATDLIEASPHFDTVCKELGQRVSPELRTLARSLEGISAAALDDALVPYHQLLQRLSVGEHVEQVAHLALRAHEADAQVQCARYEGLAGTEAGMTMFYTDLLAKLWAWTNYGSSAPITVVPGFLTEPRLLLPEAFKTNERRNPYTRLWFGPRADGVSRDSTAGVTFVFDHRFSRIYAAGSNSLRPGEEELPNEASRRTLGWWDRHYDEVADYEPQYHRLNQLMKWSLITAALAESPTGRYLRFVKVNHTAKYASWQRAHGASLRFAESLPAVHQQIGDRECIPIIASPPFERFGQTEYITGGVGTATRDAVRAVPAINRVKPLGQRRPVVATLGGPGEAAGNASRAHPVRQGTSIEFHNAARTPTNGHTGPINLGSPSTTYAPGAQPNAFVIKSGQGRSSVGELAIDTPRGGATRMAWREHGIEHALRGPSRITTREITSARMASARRVTPTDLGDKPVYIDGRVLAAHDGYLAPSGGRAAQWRLPRNTRMEELDASAIGALPDRIKVTNGPVFERFSPPPPAGAPLTFGTRPSATILLIRSCDGEGKTETKQDDC